MERGISVLQRAGVFHEIQGEDGSTAFRFECKNCGVMVWEHSYLVRDYENRFKLAAEKWNRRVENEPVRHGKWEIRQSGFSDYDCVCSECGASGTPDNKYCCDCGAKMSEEEIFNA